MRIVDLGSEPESSLRYVARLLVDGFRGRSPAWPDEESALREVRESLEPDRVSRVALDESGEVVGWVGGISHYDGHAWELHPFVVAPDRQRRGIGRLLVADLEEQVRVRGATTLWLGTDDEAGETSLAGVDLYPDVCGHIARIQNLRGHPYGLYQKVGFAIVGVIPDANGFGKPDIFMAKRVGRV